MASFKESLASAPTITSASGDGGRVSYIQSRVRSSDTTYYVSIAGQDGTTGSTYNVYNYFSTSSGVRLKENISDSNICALNTINTIKVRQFDWKETKTPDNRFYCR